MDVNNSAQMTLSTIQAIVEQPVQYSNGRLVLTGQLSIEQTSTEVQ